MPYEDHIEQSAGEHARCAVVTVSDTRTPETDKSGRRIQELLAAAGHSITRYEIVPDEPGQLQILVSDLLNERAVDVILTNGGTGISKRDQTIAVIEAAIRLPLPGFGELFRMLSFEQI